ncbi:unnamed protein product, partial [Choristocarpus tenellus]
EDNKKRVLVIRARDASCDWVMGDDLILEVKGDETMIDVQEILKSIKGIPVTRASLWKGTDPPSPISDKHMEWNLNRNGLYDGDMIEVRPSRSNQWLWHPLEWYEEHILKEVIRITEESRWKGRGCPLSYITAEVPMPPPLHRQSLRGLLRKYPERIRLELDLVSQRFYVQSNSNKWLLPSSA